MSYFLIITIIYFFRRCRRRCKKVVSVVLIICTQSTNKERMKKKIEELTLNSNKLHIKLCVYILKNDNEFLCECSTFGTHLRSILTL